MSSDIATLAASLKGNSVRPLDSGNFSGVVAVPRKYFTEGRTDQEALLAFLDDEEYWGSE